MILEAIALVATAAAFVVLFFLPTTVYEPVTPTRGLSHALPPRLAAGSCSGAAPAALLPAALPPAAPAAQPPAFLSNDSNPSPSLQVRLPCGGSLPLGQRRLQAMQANSLPNLMAGDPTYDASIRTRMADRLENHRLKSDGLDFAGKVPLSVQLLAEGISNVIVDLCQAGGLCGASDGIILGDRWAEFLEIKGASRKKRYGARSARCHDQYSFHVRLTSWKHLFLVCRPQDPSTPAGWTCKDELARCELVLGYVTRERFEAALPWRGQDTVRVTVTPWGENARNWLGKHVTLVRLADVTREWWDRHVVVP